LCSKALRELLAGGSIQPDDEDLDSRGDGALRMTDQPRFERIQGSPETLHLRYHGGRLVSFIFWLADRWREWRKLRARPGGADATLPVRRARARMLFIGLALVATVLTLGLLRAADAGAKNGPWPPPSPTKTVACAT
jgi:hypothetical protein